MEGLSVQLSHTRHSWPGPGAREGLRVQGASQTSQHPDLTRPRAMGLEAPQGTRGPSWTVNFISQWR